jgi:hypothetical protein
MNSGVSRMRARVMMLGMVRWAPEAGRTAIMGLPVFRWQSLAKTLT